MDRGLEVGLQPVRPRRARGPGRRRAILALILLAACGGVLVAGDGPRAARLAVVAARPSRIAVVDASGALSTVATDGSDRHAYPLPGFTVQFPAWSPDGRFVAAIAVGSTGSEVVVIDDRGAAGRAGRAASIAAGDSGAPVAPRRRAGCHGRLGPPGPHGQHRRRRGLRRPARAGRRLPHRRHAHLPRLGPERARDRRADRREGRPRDPPCPTRRERRSARRRRGSTPVLGLDRRWAPPRPLRRQPGRCVRRRGRREPPDEEASRVVGRSLPVPRRVGRRPLPGVRDRRPDRRSERGGGTARRPGARRGGRRGAERPGLESPRRRARLHRPRRVGPRDRAAARPRHRDGRVEGAPLGPRRRVRLGAGRSDGCGDPAGPARRHDQRAGSDRGAQCPPRGRAAGSAGRTRDRRGTGGQRPRSARSAPRVRRRGQRRDPVRDADRAAGRHPGPVPAVLRPVRSQPPRLVAGRRRRRAAARGQPPACLTSRSCRSTARRPDASPTAWRPSGARSSRGPARASAAGPWRPAGRPSAVPGRIGAARRGRGSPRSAHARRPKASILGGIRATM